MKVICFGRNGFVWARVKHSSRLRFVCVSFQRDEKMWKKTVLDNNKRWLLLVLDAGLKREYGKRIRFLVGSGVS
jgi:hypothetical protein